MKTAIASIGKDLDSIVSEKFGRADYFLITDNDASKIEEVIENSFKKDNTGAGISCAGLLADKGVKIIIAGNLGPKAKDVLDAAKIDFLSFSGKVLKSLTLAREGKLDNENPLSDNKTDQTGFKPGFGRGLRGRGKGMGQGFGRGRGRKKGLCQNSFGRQ
jgi:predicted Fe-Mo cluster-binding NifX family protein